MSRDRVIKNTVLSDEKMPYSKHMEAQSEKELKVRDKERVIKRVGEALERVTPYNAVKATGNPITGEEVCLDGTRIDHNKHKKIGKVFIHTPQYGLLDGAKMCLYKKKKGYVFPWSYIEYNCIEASGFLFIKRKGDRRGKSIYHTLDVHDNIIREEVVGGMTIQEYAERFINLIYGKS